MQYDVPANPTVKVVKIDGFGDKANIPHGAIDAVTARERSYSVIFYRLCLVHGSAAVRRSY